MLLIICSQKLIHLQHIFRIFWICLESVWNPTHAFGGASNETLMKLSREATEISIASLESLTASKETLMRRLWVFSFSNFSQSYYNRLLVKIVLQYNFGKVSRDMNMTVQRVF